MKFLIIRLSSIGDIVLTTPVIKAVKERYPDAVVDFLVKKEYHGLLSVNPHLNRIITLDSNGVHKGLNGLLKISKELRAGGYTHVIDLHGNLRSRMISILLPGSKTLRYDKQVLKRRLLLSGFKVKTRHTVSAYLASLLPLGIGMQEHLPNPLIYISKDEEVGAKRLLAQAGISECEVLVGIAPGARWPTKRWMEDGFIEIGRKAVKELGASVLIFGGPGEADLSKRVVAEIGNKALSVVGATGLKEVAALIKRCKVFVSNDSGPMHIATAVGTPVVAVFGPTIQGFGFSPLGESVVVEKELKCRPCSLHGSNTCPNGHFGCMKGITANEVFDKAKGVMQRRPGLGS